MKSMTLGNLVHDFLLDYLPQQKGLRKTTIRSYRDTLKLFLVDLADEKSKNISKLTLEQLSFEYVLAFLYKLEVVRNNSISTRNQRLAALHTFFEYLGRRMPEMLNLCEQVSAIPIKRAPVPETFFLSKIKS